MNAIAWASTLVPVYLIARRPLGLPSGYALAAGLAAVLVPWAVAVNVVMTESLAYPMFAWAILAMTCALARPSWKRDAIAILAIGVATLARNQFFLLAPVFVLAALAQTFTAPEAAGPAARTGASVWERLRSHALLFGLAVLGVLVLIALLAADVDVAGAYSDALGHPAFPPGIVVATGRHLAHLVVGVGILPAILFFAWLARGLTAPSSRNEHGFALIALLTFGVLAWQVGYFAQNVGGGGYQERYISYLAPLVALGAVALIADRGRARPGRDAGVRRGGRDGLHRLRRPAVPGGRERGGVRARGQRRARRSTRCSRATSASGAGGCSGGRSRRSTASPWAPR